MREVPVRVQPFVSLAFAFGLAWLIVPRVHAAHPDRTAKCEAGKVAAAGKRVSGATACHQKALTKGTTASAACLGKVDKKFRAAVAKADAAGTCPGTADDLAAAADAYVATLLVSVVPTTTTTTTTTVSTTTTVPSCLVLSCTLEADCGPGCGPCFMSLCLGYNGS